MVYWNEWKSLIGGGIGFIILGIFMMILSAMPNASGAVGPGGLSIMQIGIIFHVQARLFAKYIKGEIDNYPPFYWR